MRTLRDGLKYWLALALMTCLPMAGRAAMFQVPVAAGGGGGSLTGSVWFPGPFSVSGTNWYLNAGISNLALNLPMTNNWNSWQIYGSPTVSNSMFAVNRGLGIVTNSTSFSGLLQSIANMRQDGAHILLMPNPYMSNSYSCDSTVYITNGWLTLEGYGNPGSVIRGTAALNGPAIEVGAQIHNIGGIVRFKSVRIELDNAGANSVGYKIIDCAEPVWEECEVTGFGRAGIELASTNYMHWGYMKTVWCVSKRASAKGLLVSDGPLASVRHLNHFEVYDCQFGTFGGGEGILVNADFPNFRVINSTFKFSSGSIDYGVLHNYGRDAVYSGNKFVGYAGVSPIIFAAGIYSGTGVTNLNPRFYGNSSDGTAPLIELGAFVTNVAMSGNSISGSGPVVLYEDQASNGQINNLDPRELRLGSLSTNALLMTDAYGLVRTTALVNLTLSGGTLTASGGSGGTNFAGIIVTNLADIKGHATITSNLTVSGLDVSFNASAGSTFSVVNASNYFGGRVQMAGMIPGVNKVLVSQDASGNAAWSNSLYLSSLTVTGAVSMLGDGTAPGSDTLYGTNAIGYTTKAANSNSVAVTNIVGILHKANAVYIELDCNHGNDFHITNRIAQNTIVNWLNPAQGQTLSLRLHGAASGGSDYFVTNTFPSAWLVANQSSNSAPLAVQLPVSVLDGTGAEINIKNYRLFTGTTNIAGAIINTYTE